MPFSAEDNAKADSFLKTVVTPTAPQSSFTGTAGSWVDDYNSAIKTKNDAAMKQAQTQQQNQQNAPPPPPQSNWWDKITGAVKGVENLAKNVIKNPATLAAIPGASNVAAISAAGTAPAQSMAQTFARPVVSAVKGVQGGSYENQISPMNIPGIGSVLPYGAIETANPEKQKEVMNTGIMDVINALSVGGEAGLGEKQAEKVFNVLKKSPFIGPMIEKVTSKIAPAATEISEKALSLNPDELAKVNKTELSYLKPKALEPVGTTGGMFTPKNYNMVPEVKKLSAEFPDILNGKTAEENMSKAIDAGKKLNQESSKIVAENSRMMNKDTLKAKLISSVQKELPGLANSAYEMPTETQTKAMSEKVVNDFMAYVEKGNTKGIEDARIAWRAENASAAGKLKAPDEVLHKAIRDVIIESLPDEVKATYQANAQKMAKIFDIRAILRAKIGATIGKAKVPVGPILKKAAEITGAGGLGYLIGKDTGILP